MNYQKIYSSFVSERRLRKPIGYSELHHILPRSLGGTDDPSNLVRLTAREHYFAHCCLAKIHGGGMWHALTLMSRTQKGEHGAKVFRMGRMYAVAKKRSAEVRSNAVAVGWLLGTVKGRKNYGPISEKHRAAVRASGARPRPNKAAEVAKAVATRQASAPKFSFVHTATGEVFRGTALDFRKHTGVGQSHVSLLVRGKVLFAKGWALEGNQEKPQGSRDHTVRVFQHRDGRVFEGTAYDFNAEHIRDSGMLSNCINGKNGVKSARGWIYVGKKETA